MVNWLRNNRIAAALLFFARIYLGWQWIDAGWHKLTGGFNAGGFLNGAINKPVMETGTEALQYPHFVDFLKHFALPNVDILNLMIPVGEFLVGLGLILGALTTAAAFFGVMMNFMFLLAGTVSSNPWLILFGTVILFAGANAGKFGVDYYALPLIRKLAARMFHRDRHNRHTPIDPKGLTPVN
ncbi:DoxX family protein [Cohnella lubricantis]|nr:DoxX family protein [Cohnella lubricantis]MBP2119199.1 thiosulfate dehydrogenase [quinone] large subunit [Cohnella lubricantis]